jgi:hypothetical protein
MLSAKAIAEVLPTHLGGFFYWTLAHEFAALIQFLLASSTVETPVTYHLHVRLGQMLEKSPHEILCRQLHDTANLGT